MWRMARWVAGFMSATTFSAFAQGMFSDEWIRIAEYREPSVCVAIRHRLHIKVVRGTVALSSSRWAIHGQDVVFEFGDAGCLWTGLISTSTEADTAAALRGVETSNQQPITRRYAPDSASCPDVDVFFTLQNSEFWLGITSRGEFTEGWRDGGGVSRDRILLNLGVGECRVSLLAVAR